MVVEWWTRRGGTVDTARWRLGGIRGGQVVGLVNMIFVSHCNYVYLYLVNYLVHFVIFWLILM